MTEKNIVAKIQVLAHNELSEENQKLVDLAKEATQSSYAPYSRFNVGAALLLDNGVMVKGSNQENAAFSAGICAERSACFNAGANYPGVPVKSIAITAFQNGDFLEEPCPPCGVCRQALLEFEVKAGRPIHIYLVGRDKIYHIVGVKSLLPLSFTDF